MADTTTKEEKITGKIDKGITGELAIVGTGGAMSLVPRNMNEVMEFAKVMSTAGVCIPAAFRNNPGMCLAVTMQALRWGMDPFAVANKSYVVNTKDGDSKVAYEAQLFHAVVNERAPLTKRLKISYEGSGVARTCTIEGWLEGEEEAKLYTSPPVQNITVKNSPLWQGDLDQQLSYYAIRAWARKWVPEIIMGVYTVEELAADSFHQGPEHAKDITPERPKIEDYRDEPADFELISQFGEVMGTFGPRGWGDAMANQLSHFRTINLERSALETFVLNNKPNLERLRELSPKVAEELSGSFDYTLEKMSEEKTEDAAQESDSSPEQESTPETPESASPSASEDAPDPNKIIWHDSKGKAHDFDSIIALKAEVAKGLEDKRITAESVQRVLDNNKKQLASLRAEGGPALAIVDDITEMLEKRIQELSDK